MLLSCIPPALVDAQKSDDGFTPLHLAAHLGFKDIAQCLILRVRCRLRLTFSSKAGKAGIPGKYKLSLPKQFS